MDQSALEVLALNLAASALAAPKGLTPACSERRQTVIAGESPCLGGEIGQRLCALLVAADREGELPSDLAALVHERLGQGRHLLTVGTRAAVEPRAEAAPGNSPTSDSEGGENAQVAPTAGSAVGNRSPFSDFLDTWRFERVFRPTSDLARYGRALVTWTIPSEERLISGLSHLIGLLLREFGFPQDDWMSTIPLVIDEIVTNAMRHGNGGCAGKRVHIRVEVEATLFSLTVTDEGSGFRREQIADPREGDRLWQPGGRGLFLIESLMDLVEYRDCGRTVHAEKRNAARVSEEPADGGLPPTSPCNSAD